MAKIAVVEDNDAMREQLCGFIAQYARESGRQLDVTAFADGAEIVDPYRPGFDIIFLDIEMPTLGGMPTAERIRQVDPDVVLVFVTNMAQYAIRGYEVDALDFVLKPVSYYQFSTKLERALQRIQRRRGGQIALQVGGGVQLLNTDDILYLETRDRLLHYHTAADTWSVRGSLQKAEKELAPYHFARCNQCYLVNLRHVTGVQNDFVQIGKEQLEISRRQRGAFLAAVAGNLPPAVSFGFCGHGTLCAGHYLGQQRAHLGPDAAGDLWRVLFVGEHFYKIVYPAGRRCQRLLQRLDRAYVGIYL